MGLAFLAPLPPPSSAAQQGVRKSGTQASTAHRSLVSSLPRGILATSNVRSSRGFRCFQLVQSSRNGGGAC
eukprot:scaffold10136_cov126-Isochrysis_galbana.AAC.10